MGNVKGIELTRWVPLDRVCLSRRGRKRLRSQSICCNSLPTAFAAWKRAMKRKTNASANLLVKAVHEIEVVLRL